MQVQSLQLTWRVLPEASLTQRGSLISSQPKMVGSSLYSIPVIEFFLVKTVCKCTVTSISQSFKRLSLSQLYEILNSFMRYIRQTRKKKLLVSSPFSFSFSFYILGLAYSHSIGHQSVQILVQRSDSGVSDAGTSTKTEEWL